MVWACGFHRRQDQRITGSQELVMTNLEHGLEVAAPPAEPMKRFTLDVPVCLYRRIKAVCVLN
jgi:hypothetical protein